MLQYEKDDDDPYGASAVCKAEGGLVAEVWMDAVPLLPGAAECVRAGILSSLHPQVE